MQSRGLAIFDFDGTVADSRQWFFDILNEVAERHGFRTVSPMEREVLRNLSNQEILDRVEVPMWKLPAIGTTVRRLAVRDMDKIKPFPWVADLFCQLVERNILIAIVSSNAEGTIRRILGQEIASSITHFGCGASLFGKAAKLKACMKACAASTHRTISIGDEVRDVEAARAAGLASLAVTWGYASASALRSARPTKMIDDPIEVRKWFEKHAVKGVSL